MLRCAPSPLVKLSPRYASSRRPFARLAFEIVLSSLQSRFFEHWSKKQSAKYGAAPAPMT
jgi:hypothetical protein